MANMIVDQTGGRNLLAVTSLPQEPAIVTAIEQSVQAMGPFGPVRAAQRRYIAESPEALGTARRLRVSQEECDLVMDELRQVCQATQERETWWRQGVESMMLEVSDREYERNRLLGASQAEWS